MRNHDVSKESTSRKRLVQINEKTANAAAVAAETATNAADDTKKALIWIRPRQKDVRVNMTARRG
jgi:hypothetical protein